MDLYLGVHDTEEYKNAVRRIGPSNPYHLLRMSFDDALDLFEDDYFDFIYIDGFAHSGEEGGRTIIGWYQKLKVGGVIARDDYHSDWPLVMWTVNHFVQSVDCQLFTTEIVEDDPYCQYPSSFMVKEAPFSGTISPSEELIMLGERENRRVHKMRYGFNSRALVVKLSEVLGIKEFLKKYIVRK